MRESLQSPSVDVIIPVYNEGRNILQTLQGLRDHVRTPARVLICYDMESDDTLPVVRAHPEAHAGMPVEFVRNYGRGAHSAVMSGFAASSAPAVIVFPADDHLNAPILERMLTLAAEGNDIVCASRFMPGGTMEGCPWLKAVLVRTAAFLMYYAAWVPTKDPTSGFRLFSRRLVKHVPVESTEGFCYSIELLVKAHRMGLRVAEVPAQWAERTEGRSRFRVLHWLPHYLRWFFYAFGTTYLHLPPPVSLPHKG